MADPSMAHVAICDGATTPLWASALMHTLVRYVFNGAFNVLLTALAAAVGHPALKGKIVVGYVTKPGGAVTVISKH